MSDDDDDGEHYFLQPVKGYNIVEKIKLANEQLYELEIPYKTNKRSKVQFRENLVDFEPDCSSDDGYGESATSTSDHEPKKKGNDKRSYDEPCDLERELDNLRCPNNNDSSNCKKKIIQNPESDEESSVEEEEACTKCLSSDDEIPDETVCDSNCEEEEDDEDEEDFEEECHGECNEKKSKPPSKDCSECEMVEKVVANLVLEQVKKDEEEAKKPPPEPPKKKKPLYKSKFGRYGRGNNENATFEVIETEFGRFRGCCRHKVEHVEGMPGYQGARSLYGLSEEQYQKREEKLQKLELLEQQKIAKLKEEYVKKSNETEDAFAQWLKQKAKSKPSRMKNMYDQKPQVKTTQKVLRSQKGPKKLLPNNNSSKINNNVEDTASKKS
ncbi:transcriptional regulator ATRX homolog [Culicoides brevitarsis]|uniref:transcriptional regulator ATRX homolog n=1 Tax=Culicoides brevitarsis TaxID=469753 RepID=UPI00307C4F65